MTKVRLVAGILMALAVGAAAMAQQPEKTMEQLLDEQNRKIEALMQRIKDLEIIQEEEIVKSVDSSKKMEQVEQKLNDPAMFKEVEEATIARLVRAELDKGNSMRAFWNNGLNFQTADKMFTAKIGGRVMVDWTWRNEDDRIRDLVGSVDDGVRFRRLRLEASGTVHENWEYAVQVDFAGENHALKDAYIRYKGLPFDVTVGHVKEPFGLEELTSSKYITMMERSTATNAFAPSHNMGILLSDDIAKRATWAVGIFRDTDDTGTEIREGGSNITARITGLPYYANDGKQLIHLGAAASRRSLRRPDNTARFRARPDTGIGPRFIDTGNIVGSKEMYLLGVEAAAVYGPASLQAEYMKADVNRSGAPDVTFDGYYIQASYFLTGEHRPYSTSTGTFGRVRPKKNFSLKEGGWGAWEVAARYSNLDLNDSNIAGGEMDVTTLGLNWYINPVTRVMFNYSRANVDRGDVRNGDANIFGMRFQIEF